MRTIICGGRDYYLTSDDYDFLETIREKITRVISGGAKGADRCGEEWAKKNGLPLRIVDGEWSFFGKQADYSRFMAMSDIADAVVVFPGGKGTQMMFDIAKKKKLHIWDRRVD